MRPDALELDAFLARVKRRLVVRALATGALAGIAVALVLAIATRVVVALPALPAPPALTPLAASPARAGAVSLLLAVLGAGVRLLMTAGERRRAALLVERRAPQSRNLVLTASELAADDGSAAPIAALVRARAVRLARTLDPASIVPLQKTLIAVVAVAGAWGLVVSQGRSLRLAPAANTRAFGAPAIAGIEVRVEPPAYAGRPAQSLRDPARVEALAGSRLRITVRANADLLALETLDAHDTLPASTPGVFVADLTAGTDGYVALEPLSTKAGDSALEPLSTKADNSPAANGLGTTGAPGAAGASNEGEARGAALMSGARRLIGITVTLDDAPRVRITAPGKDVSFSDGHHTLDLAVEAGDDIGLASLRVRYTKVSGSGERFTFKEGEVPVTVARADARTWTARARWRLDDLALEPGDMVVYRAVAADRRPGAAPSESDAFIAEVLAPGQNAAGGFTLDPEQQRYAASQQMVILKTERLAERAASMARDSVTAEAQDIAAEQRKVRAEFVFMMGGELVDAPDPNGDINNLNEEAEAEGEDDLLAGRSANKGRVALVRAIRAMSRASSALTIARLDSALVHERVALTQLEQAFSHSRILLRALTERERLDFSRRLTGELAGVTRSTRPAPSPELAARAASLRRVLAEIAALAGARRLDARASARATMLAEQVLQVDPSARPLQAIAATLDTAARVLASSRADEAGARAAFDRAAVAIAAALQADVRPAPAIGPSLESDRVSGALADALRRGAP